MALTSPDIKGSNPFLDLMIAISQSSEGITNQQVADATSAVNYGNLEQSINNFWYGPDNGKNLQHWITLIQQEADSNDKNASNKIAEYQADFNAASAQAQSATSNADSLMQSANSQASNDATNIQSTNQLAQLLNIIGFCASLMSKS